jgi:triosephosphate isomerase
MRRPLVAGNWKLHGTRAANARRVAALRAGFESEAAVDCVVCPPFCYLEEVGRALRGSPIHLGAQSVSAERGGAYTGEVSAAMLKDVGCEYVIIGHSERRALFGEDDQRVAAQFAAVIEQGLTPVLCVGETLAEREAGAAESVIARQLDAILDAAGPAPGTGSGAGPAGLGGLARVIIAYEPIWAIGTGRVATPTQAQALHAFIRGRIASRDAKIAAHVRILYGGSVKPGNAAELFAQPDVDGGLVGGASLEADEFLAILASAGQPADPALTR